jgi:hypothetical protein
MCSHSKVVCTAVEVKCGGAEAGLGRTYVNKEHAFLMSVFFLLSRYTSSMERAAAHTVPQRTLCRSECFFC